MEIPDDAEDVSSEAIGALQCLRDLLAGQSPTAAGELTGVRASDLGYMIQMIHRQVVHAHQITFGRPPPAAHNDDIARAQRERLTAATVP